MSETKERILRTALELFARDGYEAVSVSDIAGALGMTKGALYRHYRSKRDIFERILERMEMRDAEGAQNHALPAGTSGEMPEAYAAASLESLLDYAAAQFLYWTEDEFAAAFRRLLTLEQYRGGEMQQLYQQYLASGPLHYTEDLLAAMGFSQPAELAAEICAPMHLLYSVYDGAERKETAAELLAGCFARVRRRAEEEIKDRNGEKSMEKNITIRLERKEEQHAVEELVREAFWNVYRPGCLEHYVLHCLRDDPRFIPELNYVLEKDGKVIGQNVFVRAAIRADDGREIPVAAMGPICITPALKRQGYGKLLLDFTLEEAKRCGLKAVCFEGNIDFYGKSGFDYASRFGIRYHGVPEGEDTSFFLCRELEEGYLDGVTGEYAPPECYLVDEGEAERFDALFPPKEKKVLPGQLFG